ncbi:MAG: hypothetical protein H7Y13_16775 [Sphingobacteriaceae bacterium]|nr:hypothetical protein [Sphingobacteriaceae bacterium]
MDSKELYNATAYLTRVVDWDKNWIPFGTGSEIRNDLIVELIDVFLSDDNLYFVYERQNSGGYKNSEIMNVIKEFLGKESFQLWNSKLDRVIAFNRIGVLQKGRK